MRFKFLLLFLLPTFAFGGCLGCSKYRLCGDRFPRCHPRQLPGWWFSGEYLLLWRKARFFPPLVTTNTLGGFPILGAPGTEVLFGDESLRKSPKSGFRGDVGLWVTPCIGFGGGGWGVKDEKINFFERGTLGNPILGRPFFDVTLGIPVFEPISMGPPLFVSGSIDISAANSLCGGDVYARYRFLATRVFKFDFLGGFGLTRIDDNLDINANAESPLEPLAFIVHDHFSTENHFYAGIIGVLAEARSKNWALYFNGKLGLGNMVQHVTVDGFTIINNSLLGTSTTFVGGLLALPTNMGKHGQHGFGVSTQSSIQVQLRVCDHIWLTAGYTHMFWQRVALSGDQIDLNVNTSQRFGGTLIGPAEPEFEFHTKNFYLHGATVGFSILY